MIAIDLSEQQGLEVEPKAVQQINFTGNLERQATTFFITKEALKFKLGIKNGTEVIINWDIKSSWFNGKYTIALKYEPRI